MIQEYRFVFLECDRNLMHLQRAKEVLTKHSLDPRVSALVKLLFDANMFKEQMEVIQIILKDLNQVKCAVQRIANAVSTHNERQRLQEEEQSKKEEED